MMARDEGSSHVGATTQYSVLLGMHEPLGSVVKVLREAYNLEIGEYEVWLQNMQYLDVDSTLAEICVEGEGKVHIQLDVSLGDTGIVKINIVDVVKPPEEEPVIEEESRTRWMEDPLFKAEQERLKMPSDPQEWTREHVQFWLNWAVKRFSLKQINPAMWKNIDGVSLCTMTHTVFKQLVRSDENDNFWTHIKLLRDCKFVAVLQKTTQPRKRPVGSASVRPRIEPPGSGFSHFDTTDSAGKRSAISTAAAAAAARLGMPRAADYVRSGGNSQVQLWQFLLDLLTSWEHRWAIAWVSDEGCEGEFILLEPERVAALWGLKKNKPNMNYEKLSRALRYYYEGDMITKVPNKRFVYKFVCDLKQLLGFSASDINRMLVECERKAVKRYGVPRPLDD